MSGECNKCHEHCLDCKCESNKTKIIKENGELFPFTCPKCKGFNDCEYSLNGLCLCP